MLSIMGICLSGDRTKFYSTFTGLNKKGKNKYLMLVSETLNGSFSVYVKMSGDIYHLKINVPASLKNNHVIDACVIYL